MALCKPAIASATAALMRSITGSDTAEAGGGSWSPARLFAAGEFGYALDPSDFTTMFQDAAGSVSVTAVTQPVGRLLDVSGNGNHFTQTTDTRRPTWQQDGSGYYYLDGNGLGQCMERATVTVPAGVRKATAWFAIRRDADTKTWAFHSLAGTSGGLGAYLQTGTLNNMTPKMSGGEVYSNNAALSEVNIFCVQYDNTTTTFGSNIKIRKNGVAAPLTNVAANTVTDFVTALHRIMAEGSTSNSLNGGLYGVVLRFAESTADELALGERWLSERCGVPV